VIDPVESPVSTALDVLREFGLRIQFLTNAADQLALPQVNRVILWALDDPGDFDWSGAGDTPVSRMLRYTVHHVPPLSFDELQERVRGGFERLGVLRMDVDNLGEIFTRGFGEPGAADNLSTLARLSMLSFQISLFFEGWVKKLCERQPELVYPVYSGGDDLFLIGPWDIMPGLAADIRAEFSRFTAGHPSLSISGGMAFIGGKYPIYQAAKDAQQAEAQAKESGKDAFFFLGQAWSWSVFNRLAEKKHRILRIVARREIDIDSLEGPQAVLHVLRQLAADEADEARRMKGRPVWGRWLWQGPYQLTRMAERQRNKPELASAINQLRDDLDKNNYSEINQWGAAARWAQLESRKSGKEE
jgi:CRISPR-associated protein Csm1